MHSGKKYKLLNCKKTNGNVPYNVIFPTQFAHLLVQYQQHPEAKSLAPDGTPCQADTMGLLKRAHVIAGEIRYVGRETDRKWEEGDEISVLEFAATEYGRKGKVVANEEVKAQISSIGINKCAREGLVVLQAEINEDGTVEKLELISGHPLLVSAAIDAVKHWIYNPYLLDGKAVKVDTEVVINFTFSVRAPIVWLMPGFASADCRVSLLTTRVKRSLGLDPSNP